MMDEVRNIPFRNVPYSCRVQLANKLNPAVCVKGNNWKMLAEKLGFNIDEIESVEAQHESFTIKVMADYDKLGGNSIGNFCDALKEIKRPDALEILENAFSDITEKYLRYKEEDRLRSQVSAPVENCYCSDLQSNNFCQLCNSCRDFSTRHNIIYHRSMSIDEPLQSECSNPQCPVREKHSVRYPAYCNCRRLQDYHSQNIVNNRSLQMNMNIPVCHSGMTHMSHLSPDSLNVNMNSFPSRDYQDVEDMDVGQEYYDTPLPLHEGLLRQQQLNNVPLLRSPLDSGLMVGAEEEVTTTNEIISDSDRIPISNLNRQESDENNSDQSFSVHQPECGILSGCTSPGISSPTVPFKAPPLSKLEMLANSDTFMPKQNYHKYIHNAKGNIQQEDRMKVPARHIKCEPVESATFNCSQHFPNYNHCVNSVSSPKKKILQSVTMRINDQNPSYASRRVKNNSTGSTPESIPDTRLLTKCHSLPDNMKPSEFKKAFRDISIFISYSFDNEVHVRNVLNLCRCIGENGFSCSMDIFHRKLSATDKEQWYSNMFYQADFVLVCISKKYQIDITQEVNSPMNGHDPDELHTRLIYQLMDEEYVRNGRKTTRFVPLLFNESDRQHIPECLQDTFVYNWPSQWKDVLWLLTKPEERLRHLTKRRN